VADYKLARPGDPGWPETLQDLFEAVRWIRRHADEFRVDPDRLAALGSGAGGHLAALLGTSAATLPGEASARVQAVVSLYGPSDLEELIRHRGLANDPAGVFLGDSLVGVGQAAVFSPINQISPLVPPMLLIHGTDDAWVPPEQSRRLVDALARAGVRHRLIEVPGARHGFELEVGFPESRDLVPDVLAFLESVWQVHLGDQP
jgi:acetyl esterase/lipase